MYIHIHEGANQMLSIPEFSGIFSLKFYSLSFNIQKKEVNFQEEIPEFSRLKTSNIRTKKLIKFPPMYYLEIDLITTRQCAMTNTLLHISVYSVLTH
jgi:hypothetical protein